MASSRRPSACEHVAQVVLSRGQVGAQPDSLAAVDEPLLGHPLLGEHPSQVAATLRERGVEPDGTLEMLKRRGLVSLGPQRVAQAVVGGGELGPQADRFAKVLDRVVSVSQAIQQEPQVEVSLGVVGLKPQGGSAALDGAVGLTDGLVSLGKVGEDASDRSGLRVVARAINRTAFSGSPRWSATSPTRCRASGLFGFSAKCGLIHTRRSLELAAPMLLQSDVQVDSHRAHPQEEPEATDHDLHPSYNN